MVVPEHQLVEGSDARLHVQIHEPADDAGLPPVLLLHGFASSSQLNWADAGWLTTLSDAGRRAISVDLPGHGQSGAPTELAAYAPSRIRADLLQVLSDAHVRPLAAGNPGSGVDIIGYSFGSRLAWELGAAQPELVRRLVLGGPSPLDRFTGFDLDAARDFLAEETPIDDPVTASFMEMANLARANMPALMRFVEGAKREPYVPADCIPAQPILLVAGDKDEIAAPMQELADLSPAAQILWLPARTHINAITSRAFKKAAMEFLAA